MSNPEEKCMKFFELFLSKNKFVYKYVDKIYLWFL